MREVGKELDYVRNRLTDIRFLANSTKPVEGHTWEQYARALADAVAKQASDALNMLDISAALSKATQQDKEACRG
jgi:hypothetical protein